MAKAKKSAPKVHKKWAKSNTTLKTNLSFDELVKLASNTPKKKK